jgi:hypothetical protein
MPSRVDQILVEKLDDVTNLYLTSRGLYLVDKQLDVFNEHVELHAWAGPFRNAAEARAHYQRERKRE